MGNYISALQDVQLRGADQQQGDELLAQGAAMRYAGTRNPDTGEQQPQVTVRGAMAILSFSLQNRSGGAASCGIGFKLRNDQWRAGQVASSTTYTNDTVDAQDIGASDFALETTTDNSGFVILSTHKFDWVSIDIGTAGVDGAGATDRVVAYSNLAGTGFTTAPTNVFTDEFTSTNTVWPTGEAIFVWRPPQDWGKVVSIGTIPTGFYALRVLSTTAPDTTAALADAIEIGTFAKVAEGIADNGIMSEEICFYWEPFGDAIVAYFSVANGGNSVNAEWRHAG